MTTENQEIPASQDAGLIAFQQGDYATAFSEWEKLAQAGHSQAMHNLAIMYEQGLGITPNPEQALYWCQQSAQAGNTQAQTHLGYILHANEQPKAAIEWWQKAAEAGDADAQNNLGLAYHTGQGVAKDDDSAADWFEAAAQQNHSEAQFNMGVLYANGQRFSHARHWWNKAAKQGNENAQQALQQLDDMGA